MNFMDKKSYVYKHLRSDNKQVFYVGIGTGKKYARAYYHYNRTKFWKAVANKYGWEVEIVIDDIEYSEAISKEKELIKLYGRIDNNTGILVNLTDGGEGAIGCIGTEQKRRKISEANISRKRPESHRIALSKRAKGNTYRKGKPSSPESILKMIKTRTGMKVKSSPRSNPFTAEHCANLSKALTGRKRSEESKKKQGNSRTGRKLSKETRLKMRQSRLEYFRKNPPKSGYKIIGRKAPAKTKDKNQLQLF